MTNNELHELVDGNFEYYGFRADDAAYEIGDILPDSRIWVDGEPTDETLDGTSCVGIHAGADMAEIMAAMEMMDAYFADHLYVIAGSSMEYGEDAGEYIIKDAQVVGVIR